MKKAQYKFRGPIPQDAIEVVEFELAPPDTGEVLIEVLAAPINPSDLGLLFGPADMQSATSGGSADRPVVTAPIPSGLMKSVTARLDQPMPVGNEGAGIVVDAGASDAAQALIGKTVAVIGGAMYSQYRVAPAAMCLPLPDGTTPAEGASCFVNPLTALGMVETMRLEGHSALVHTAAASNLGQMLNKICLADDVALVNIVRRPEQEDILRSIGATPSVIVDVAPVEVRPGDRFLLCSDGLSGVVTDSEIGAVLLSESPESAVRMLVDLANQRGGPDNVTVMVTAIPGEPMGGAIASGWETGTAAGTFGRVRWIAAAAALIVALLALLLIR